MMSFSIPLTSNCDYLASQIRRLVRRSVFPAERPDPVNLRLSRTNQKR